MRRSKWLFVLTAMSLATVPLLSSGQQPAAPAPTATPIPAADVLAAANNVAAMMNGAKYTYYDYGSGIADRDVTYTANDGTKQPAAQPGNPNSTNCKGFSFLVAYTVLEADSRKLFDNQAPAQIASFYDLWYRNPVNATLTDDTGLQAAITNMKWGSRHDVNEMQQGDFVYFYGTSSNDHDAPRWHTGVVTAVTLASGAKQVTSFTFKGAHVPIAGQPNVIRDDTVTVVDLVAGGQPAGPGDQAKITTRADVQGNAIAVARLEWTPPPPPAPPAAHAAH